MNEQLIGDLFAEATRRMTGSSSREFSQKFTELIVRECAEVLLKWKGEPFPFDEDLAANLIKEHFGVEE